MRVAAKNSQKSREYGVCHPLVYAVLQDGNVSGILLLICSDK